jgi:hypothetical protein
LKLVGQAIGNRIAAVRLSIGDVAFKEAFDPVLFYVAMMWTAPAIAQFTMARLSGTVLDKAGVAVSGATAIAEQGGTGCRQTVKAGAVGGYLFPSLPIGSYELTIQMPGLNTYVPKGIVLTVGRAASQDVTLQVGAAAQQVKVQANSSLVTTVRIGWTVDRTEGHGGFTSEWARGATASFSHAGS